MEQSTNQVIKQTEKYVARNYSPLPLLLKKQEKLGLLIQKVINI